MSLFSKVKIKVKAKRNVKLQNNRYSLKNKERSGVVVGNRLVSVGGQLFESNFSGNIGDTVTVTNVGTPAAALYAQSTTGAVSSSTGGSGNVTVVSDGALATITAHMAQGYVEGHATSPATRVYHSIKYNVVGGAGVDESNNILYMLNTVGANGGGTCVIAAADGASPIHIAKTISIYYSNVHVVFPPGQVLTYEDKASLRIMGDYAQITRKVDGTAMKLHVDSTVVSNETVLELSATDTALMDAEANPALRIVRVGDKIVVRGQNDASGKSIEKDTSFVKALAKVGSYWQITCTDELDYTFKPTYPASEWPADLTTGTTIYVIEGSLITVNTDVNDTVVTVTDGTVFSVGDMVEVGDNRNEYAMNASAITGAGNPYKNPANLEQAQIIAISGNDITLDHALCRAASTTYYAFMALMVPVVNSTISGAVITYVADGIRSANALQITYALECHIHHCKVYGIGGRKGHGLRISYSYKCTAYQNDIIGALYTGSGEGYGITIYYATLITVNDNYISGCRHNILLQLATLAKVIANTSIDDRISGIDLHGVYSVFCTVQSNSITRSRQNTTDSDKSGGIRIGNTSHTGGDHYNIIQGNTITNYFGYNDVNGSGIDIFAASTGNKILNNIIQDCWTGLRFGLNSKQITPVQTIDNTLVQGNVFARCGSRTVEIIAQPVYDNTNSNGKFSNITMVDNVSDSNNRHFEITGVVTNLGVTNVIMSGNKIINPTNVTTTYYGVSVKYTDGFVHIYDNNVSKAQRGIYLQGNGVCHVIGNKTANTVQTDPFTDGGGNTSVNYVDAMTGGVISTAFTTGVSVTNTEPQVIWIESDATTNNKRYDITASGEQWLFRLVNDANSAASYPIVIDRTGLTVDAITLAATSLLLSGALSLTGDLSVTGLAKVTGAVSQTALGADNLRMGIAGGAPRIIFEDNGFTQWQIDNTAGLFRWFNPGVVRMSLDTSGNLVAVGYMRGGYDTDTTSHFGRAAIGFISGYSDYMGVAHVDNNNTTDYALLQFSNGQTYLNAKSGTPLSLRIGNADKAVVSSTGLAVTGVITSSGDATVGGNLAVTGNLGTWTGVTHTGTWADFGGSDSAARYRKLGDVVFIEGFVKRSGTTGFSIFTLPSGYRPTKTKSLSTIAKHGGNQVVCKVEINTSGVVSMADPIPAATITYLILDGIQFSTT